MYRKVLTKIRAKYNTIAKTELDKINLMNEQADIGGATDIFDETAVQSLLGAASDKAASESAKRKRDKMEDSESSETEDSDDEDVQWLEHDKLIYKHLKCPHCGEKHFKLVMRILYQQVWRVVYACITCYEDFYFPPITHW